MADDIDNTTGGDTNPSFGVKDSADPALPQAPAGASAGAEADDSPQESAPKVVKICKSCMVSQSGVGGYCVNCGSALVPIRAVRDTYVGEIVGGKYKIVDRLGAGGMGEVYLGLNEPLGQQVAVKFLSKKFTADENIILRFLNEARSYCKVTHPNAVTLLEYGQHEDGALYLITEFIDGKSLSDTLKDVGPFPLDQLISISTQICEVLSAAHGQGVIHRDLKPDNIMLMPTSRGRYAVKVLDFGIAKIMDDDHANGAMTETGSVFGTPEFMSPEQACGDDTDGRSDLYAAGIILFYLATGKLPFKGKNKLVVLHKQLHESPPLPSEARDDIAVAPELEQIILKCLRKAPDQRFQSADDLLSALEAIDISTAMLAPRPTSPRPAALDTYPNSPSDHDSIETVVQNPAATPTPETPEAERPAPGGKSRETADLNELGDFSETHEPSFAGAFGDAQSLGDAEEPHAFDGVDAWEAEDVEPAYVAPSSRSRTIFLGLGLVAIVAGAGVWLYSGSGGGASVDPGGEGAVNIDQVLLTGQVIGSLAAAQDSVGHADFESAKRTVASTYTWVDDANLPPQAREQRVKLSAKIDRLIELDRAFSAALHRGDCSRAGRVLESMSAVEASAKSARGGALAECKSATESPIPASPTPAPAPEAPEAPAENTQTTDSPAPTKPVEDTPEPAPVVDATPPPPNDPPPNDPSPAEPSETQADVSPATDETAAQPDVTSTESNVPGAADTQESRLDEVMPEPQQPESQDPESQQPESQDPEPQEPESQDPAPEETPEDAGFALPPKTID